MANMSAYLRGELIKHVLRSGTFTKPANLYVALFVGASEVTGGSYARVSLPQADANWADQVAGNGASSNLAVVTFPAPTANWGAITGVKLFDAASGGNILLEGTIPAKTVNSGDAAPNFPVGTLSIIFS